MAVHATEVEMRGRDGVWRTTGVVHALRNRGKMQMRCGLCKGHVVPMDASKDGRYAAHVEHRMRWQGCPRSDVYDGGEVRSHPVSVPD
jgi:hypothetical protein